MGLSIQTWALSNHLALDWNCMPALLDCLPFLERTTSHDALRHRDYPRSTGRQLHERHLCEPFDRGVFHGANPLRCNFLSSPQKSVCDCCKPRREVELVWSPCVAEPDCAFAPNVSPGSLHLRWTICCTVAKERDCSLNRGKTGCPSGWPTLHKPCSMHICYLASHASPSLPSSFRSIHCRLQCSELADMMWHSI